MVLEPPRERLNMVLLKLVSRKSYRTAMIFTAESRQTKRRAFFRPLQRNHLNGSHDECAIRKSPIFAVKCLPFSTHFLIHSHVILI